jgi:type IV pilus assembly protein PilW
MNKQSGFSLVEIMIALLIGLFLLGGILQIFSASQQTYRMQRNLSRLQENGRFALDFITHDIRMAGNWGCLIGTNTDITNNIGVTPVDNGTDTIAIKAAFEVPPTIRCLSSVTTDPTYLDPSSTIAYKIYTLPNANPTLYKTTNGIWGPLIEGIENMQILYGIDSDGDYAANYYVPAFANMTQVVSVRISLLVVTLDDHLTTQLMTLTFNGIPYTDYKIRRVFNVTIALRNHLL